MDTQENLERLAAYDFESKETWEQDWTTDKPEFHTDEVNAMLMKQHDDFTRGRTKLRILVPLCGKSLDMIWLAEQGHSVVGVELIRNGIEAFFRDNKLTYHEKSISLSPEIQATVFKAKEKDITLFECSIFDFSVEVAGGQFDCIWDRGSMTAINMMNEGRLKQYTDIMLGFLNQDGRYFLEFFTPESPDCMPPSFRFISEKNLSELFGERCTIRFLGKEKDIPDSEQHSSDKSEVPRVDAAEQGREFSMMMHYYFMDFK
ncbi:hypothetical protein OS493_010705 [Desmophyllum pertusum]|uniref:thiopurine S-methyltransferase n=1 Tax=Desmophyllum pertusum TaxID=174260 RepID=A0A9W9ZSE8_9CNID|nr:hypothetical protein OS493_010705 [Desmophyllum pertusum]